MREDKLLKLKKVSIILSVVAIVICIGFGIYGKFVAKNDDITIWVILGLSNFSLLCGNLYSLNQK